MRDNRPRRRASASSQPASQLEGRLAGDNSLGHKGDNWPPLKPKRLQLIGGKRELASETSQLLAQQALEIARTQQVLSSELVVLVTRRASGLSAAFGCYRPGACTLSPADEQAGRATQVTATNAATTTTGGFKLNWPMSIRGTLSDCARAPSQRPRWRMWRLFRASRQAGSPKLSVSLAIWKFGLAFKQPAKVDLAVADANCPTKRRQRDKTGLLLPSSWLIGFLN